MPGSEKSMGRTESDKEVDSSSEKNKIVRLSPPYPERLLICLQIIHETTDEALYEHMESTFGISESQLEEVKALADSWSLEETKLVGHLPLMS